MPSAARRLFAGALGSCALRSFARLGSLALAAAAATASVTASGCAGKQAPPAAAPAAADAAAVADAPAAAPAGGEPSYDATLSTYAYPYPVQIFEVPHRGAALRMAYLDERPAKPNGRTVLLLHGKNFGAFYWARTIALLVDQGYRVIAPDQLGFGKSDKPRDYAYSFHALADNTRKLLDSLGVQQVAVVGHSMGGMLATRFALLSAARTSSLTLVNPIGLEDWSAVVPYRSVDEWYARELEATPDSIRAYQKASYYDGQWTPAYETLIGPAAGQTRHADYPQVAWASALTYEMVFTQPVVYEFSRLAVPTLLIIGQRDRTALGKDAVAPEVAKRLGDYPVLGARAAAAIPGAKLVALPGVGHVPQIEAWDAYAAALTEFLKAERR